MPRKKKAIKVKAERVGPSDPTDGLPPEIAAFVREHPLVTLVGMVVVGVFLMRPAAPRPSHLIVPELGGRRNSAWRGKGSFGHAPFGKQSSHR